LSKTPKVGLPSAKELVEEALHEKPQFDVNQLHLATYELMKKYRFLYYQHRVRDFLAPLKLSSEAEAKVRVALLAPTRVGDVEYSNFMEEAARRVSQVFQPLSGNLAELCAVRELEKLGLEKDVHFTVKKNRTDITICYPTVDGGRAAHRVEVKNVKLRERAARGLVFDGDSLFGFFDDVGEFTEDNVRIFEQSCKRTGGFCYLPPATLKQITHPYTRLRPNTQFGTDMAAFNKTGRIA
jgi:hypothetical protein